MSTKKKSQEAEEKEWVSQAEAARLRGVSRQAIQKLVSKGKLRTYSIGGRLLVSRADAVANRSDPAGRPTLDEDNASVTELLAIVRKAPVRIQREVLRRLRSQLAIHPLEEELGVPAEVILEAISRSSDLSKRGIRGLIAEAYFKIAVLDELKDASDITPSGNQPYDFLVEIDRRTVSIQVKMQRKKGGRPMKANQADRTLPPQDYVVETQRTRGGRDPRTGEDTRPYRFGEFDILAVSMEPSTGSWSEFRLTLGRWLIPKPDRPKLILKFQPVALEPDDDWTNSFKQCLDWHWNAPNKTIRQ